MIRELTIAGLLAFALSKSQHKKGVDFFVVGDFGWVQDMSDPNMVFDALNEVKRKADPQSN